MLLQLMLRIGVPLGQARVRGRLHSDRYMQRVMAIVLDICRHRVLIDQWLGVIAADARVYGD